MFRETTEAELEVKKGILDHLQQRKKKIEPLMAELSIEIADVEQDLEQLEKQLSKEKEDSRKL